MLDHIFKNRLDDETGNFESHQLGGNIFREGELVPEALSYNGQVGFDIFHLLPDLDEGLVVPVQGSVHDDGQGLDHFGHIFGPGHPSFPVNDFQRIVQKVGIDLGLEGFEPGIPHGDLVRENCVERIVETPRHAVESVGQGRNLPVPVEFLNRGPVAAGGDIAGFVHKAVDGLGHVLFNQNRRANQNRNQKEEREDEKGPPVVLLGEHIPVVETVHEGHGLLPEVALAPGHHEAAVVAGHRFGPSGLVL